jgi:NDP-sugar pyrophosphorylase family protein
MQCLVLAGGLGTRMLPLTQRQPKALVEVAGRPFLDHQLRWLSKCGVRDVVLSIGHLGEQIREYAADGSSWGVHIRYVDEGQALRGTAGAVRLALDQGVLAESFLLTYGDSFLPVDFAAVYNEFCRSGSDVLMTVLRNEGRWDRSNVIYEHGKVVLYDKRNRTKPVEAFSYIDYGLLAFRRTVIETRIEPGLVVDLADVLEQLSVEGCVAGAEVTERFYEIGSPAGLDALRRWLQSGGAR